MKPFRLTPACINLTPCLLLTSLLALPLLILINGVPTASAVPSFARQMGVDCSQCHTQAFGPALTPFGRQFKLQGYTWSRADAPLLPLAGMIEGPSFTHTQKGQQAGDTKDFKANDNIQMDQVSAFYAGRIVDHLGLFSQVTYDGVARQTAWDNLDLRFANDTTLGDASLVYGITVNNSPTVQDLWNTTPTWWFPYASSAVAPTPAAAPLIAGGISQQVLGVTAYAMWNQWLYLEAGGYQSLSNQTLNTLGVSSADMNQINSPAPYWRIALQHDWSDQYFSLGAFGLWAKANPNRDTSAGNDRYTDLGLDASYQRLGDKIHIFGLNATYIHESLDLSASKDLGDAAHAGNHLNDFNINAYYIFRQTVTGTLGYFSTTGSRDADLYQPEPISGSANGKPDSNGYIVEVDYTPFGKPGSWLAPWANTRLSLQYTFYNKFNGRNSDYDGSGRKASDNNTLYLLAWFLF